MLVKCKADKQTQIQFTRIETAAQNGHEKVQVGKDQEKAQSDKGSHSKNRDGGKKQINRLTDRHNFIHLSPNWTYKD